MTRKAVLFCILGVFIAVLTKGYFWLLENIEDPEADMAPLAIVTGANAAVFDSMGVAFPANDGVRIQLNSIQVRTLMGHLARHAQNPKLTNRFGHPYIFSVMRAKDKLAPHGYVYDWAILDIGRDGKPGTADDVGVGWAGRP